MIRKLLFIALLSCGCWACSDDDDVFDMSMTQEGIRFTPMPGGAIMHYTLPENENIMNIKVRYKDAHGVDMLRVGSYVADSLTIIGFDEAQTGVPAQVTLADKHGVESEPINVTFDTQDSGPIEFFKSVEVSSGWNGFVVKYNISRNTEGLANVFYVGENPTTNTQDTLLVSSFLLSSTGRDSLTFSPQQVLDSYDVVIRVENFRGYVVGQRMWNDIAALPADTIPASDFSFLGCLAANGDDLTIDDPAARLGASYLFDGDKKGEQTRTAAPYEQFFTYLAGPGAIGRPLVVDYGTPRKTAEVRLFAMLNVEMYFPSMQVYPYNPYSQMWDGRALDEIPCQVTLYGTNSDDYLDESSWVSLGSFTQDPDIAKASRYCPHSIDSDETFLSTTSQRIPYESLDNYDDEYLAITCQPNQEAYRYVLIVVEDCFNLVEGVSYPGGPGANINGYVTINELEILAEVEK